MRGDYLLDMVFPQGIYCVICGKYIDRSRKYALCDHCIKRMNFNHSTISWGYDFAMSAIGYGLYERRLIFNLKYDGKTYISRIIADILYDAIFDRVAKGMECPIVSGDVIVPVPIHRRRLNERGFNQTEKIATHLGRKLKIPVGKNVLLRQKNTNAQRALSAEERKLNMEGAFFINEKNSKEIIGKNVILLDDIYTTGATAESCAKVIAEYGPKKIYYLSLLFAGNRHHLMVK